MKKIGLKFVFPLALCVAMVWVLSLRVFDMPPIGKFLDPYVGALNNDLESDNAGTEFVLEHEKLQASVHIVFDERQVPHIFASNNADLYFAQGFVAAQLRLWQMDFMSSAANGSLSEVFGAATLDFDRFQRRFGLQVAAERSLEFMKQDAEMNGILNAYSDGVNAYIAQLEYSDLPFEYKLFDYEPRAWAPIRSVLLIKYLGSQLSGYEEDLPMTRMLLALGDEKFNELYPEFPANVAPVVQQDSVGVPDSLDAYHAPEYLDFGFIASGDLIPTNNHNPHLGSNNWVVDGSKTASGRTILCNDPHLGLTLPSVWLEMQLHSPEQNTYGVSIPGTPAVIIGFNEQIAWGVTNGATDVRDWYKIQVREDYSQCQIAGEWTDLEYRVEEITVRGQIAFIDTVYWSSIGPLVMDQKFNPAGDLLDNYALRWELHQPSNEFKTFVGLNTAKNHDDFKEAISHFACPIQNFIFTDQSGDIAIWHQGSVPEKWDQQGRFLLDGNNPDHLYSKYRSQEDLPHSFNPESGFLFSSNQHPTASTAEYMNGYYENDRSLRIQQVLQNGDAFTIDDMQALQLDNVNLRMLEMRDYVLQVLQENNDAKYDSLVASLAKWDGSFSGNDDAPLFMDLWWNTISNLTWDELNAMDFYAPLPKPEVLVALLKTDPKSKHFDQVGTDEHEDAIALTLIAIDQALAELKTEKANGVSGWVDHNTISIEHLSKLEGLGLSGLKAGGHPNAPNAMTGSWGPSWRMVVEMKERPEAYGIYPGGQTANPASAGYDAFVDDWAAGNYFELNFYYSIEEATSAIQNQKPK
jgi:penicillin amidase